MSLELHDNPLRGDCIACTQGLHTLDLHLRNAAIHTLEYDTTCWLAGSSLVSLELNDNPLTEEWIACTQALHNFDLHPDNPHPQVWT